MAAHLNYREEWKMAPLSSIFLLHLIKNCEINNTYNLIVEDLYELDLMINFCG